MKPLKTSSANIHPDRLEMIIQNTFEGERYHFFFGQHYNGKSTCYDIACLDKVTKLIKKVHFKTKDEAIFRWDKLKKDFEAMLKRRAEHGDEDVDPMIIINPN